LVRFLKYLLLLGVLGCAVAGAYASRHRWLPWLNTSRSEPVTSTVPEAAAVGQPNEQVKLSPQALKNLGLKSQPLRPTDYWKTIEVPGMVVDRPGISDRGVVASVTGVVTAIHHYAGDTVEPGEPLFTLRIVGESFHTSQTQLFKAVQEREIVQEHIDRLAGLSQSGAVAGVKLIELRNELRRLEVSINAHRQDLQLRGLEPAQIDQVTSGTFVSHIVVAVPHQRTTANTSAASNSPSDSQPPTVFEVQELDVELGQQVQAGQRLCTLSNHHLLFIEGKAFRQELPLLQRAAEAALPIHAELAEDSDSEWNAPIAPLVIHHISNTLDDKDRTVSFYLPLENQYRTYQRNGQTLLLWRFRPGQRVRLLVQVEKLQNVFVLPAAAVVREGPEFYVFRQNGVLFDRKPVHVLHETQDEVVIANDGSVPPGIYVAQSGAVQLNRVLKSQSGSAPAGVHVHADGTVHANH